MGMKTFFLAFAIISSLIMANISGRADCMPAPTGLTAWWQAESNVNDSANLNVGTPNGALNYANGISGSGFNFNGSNAWIYVPSSPSLDVGSGSGMTIEMWINPADLMQPHPLIQWNYNPALPPDTEMGVSFWVSVPATNGGNGTGCLLIDLKDSSFRHKIVCTGSGLVTSGSWQHVAATYDKSSGNATLYLNGSLVLQTNIGSINPYTAQNLWIGSERDQIDGDKFNNIGNSSAFAFYSGLMDELSIYNRALSGTEVTALFNAGSAGKCPLAPSSAVIQPASQSVAEGETTTFSAITSGSPPLSFQWSVNGTNLPGATNLLFVLTNTMLTNSGNYSIQVSNTAGPFQSSNAVLTVLPSYAPTWGLTTAPTNLSWACVASSADGKTLAAGSYDGYLYTSQNAGRTWVSNNLPLLNWDNITISANGSRLTAAAPYSFVNGGFVNGGIYMSTNYGNTWQLSANSNWRSMAGSRDGTKLVGSYGDNIYQVIVSTNSGNNWTIYSQPGRGLGRLACSADGSTFLGSDTGNEIYISKNFGATWSLTGAPTTNYWLSLAASADGNTLYAAAWYDMQNDRVCIFASTNSGTTWYAAGPLKAPWYSIAGSDDGTKLVAGTYPGYLYISTDSGSDWVATRAPSANWSAVASSSDGTQLVAAQYPGGIYTWKPTSLDVFVLNNNFYISWPTNVPGFILEQKDSLSSASWVTVTNSPIITNSTFQVVLPANAGLEMFRLRYP
jgi:hypothetical protein